ncbi:hypothetical protein [Leucobacter japonicus]|uniref:hypothetical protein n=1 Tax=Leucobacter japonicus TaxID=1461259 RepID=UPI0006A7E264|nr:hypothetical protein [Leucobacter japonicus]
MSAISILAPDASTNNSICHVPGCQLEQHDEAAPSLHQGITKYTDAWSVSAMLDEADGRWEIDAVSTYRRDLALEEARAFAEAILTVVSWCEIVTAPEEVAA